MKMGMFKVPRIVAIRKHHEKTLLDFVDPERARKTNSYYVDPEVAQEAKSLFNDKDVLVLLFWALISPAMGLAYLIWVKYKNLRLFAVPLVGLSVVQFWLQWHGVFDVVKAFFSG